MIESIRNNIRLEPLPWTLFFITLFLHIVWPLASGGTQAHLTTLAVITLTLSSAASALLTLGVKRTLFMFVLITFMAFSVEKLGSTTGVPFGSYSYTNILQPQVLNVPLSVILAWFAMTWVMCVFVHHLSLHLLLKALLVGLLMTSWDFFLDPQMTSVKYWVWQTTEPDLPGIPGIPLINYVGWLISGTLMAIIVLVLLGQSVVQRTLARVILAWTIAGGFVLHAVFWGDLAVGIWGLSAMTLLWYVVEKRIRHRA